MIKSFSSWENSIQLVHLEGIVCYIYCGGEQFTGAFMLTQIHPHGITRITNSNSYFFVIVYAQPSH